MTVKTRSRQTHIPIVSKLRDDMSTGNSSSSRQTFQFNSIKYAQKINQNYTFIFCAFFLATFCHIVAIWVQLLVQFSSVRLSSIGCLFVCLFVRILVVFLVKWSFQQNKEAGDSCYDDMAKCWFQERHMEHSKCSRARASITTKNIDGVSSSLFAISFFWLGYCCLFKYLFE